MFVKKIEISGFKSFARKTVLDFVGQKNSESGITCIVGPNGSGKSNVSDALRWVIGEKSAKNLRGNKKEDVIFAGSSNKAKLGCAQVAVFFDNSSQQFDIDYDEVIVSRKVCRDGENNYFINNSKVRLYDLINILSKAGIGHGNYTIVNQGMTDKILLSSPIERMSFLEDAAGVKEYQIKKIASIRRMKKTEKNIEKAQSQMREIQPELRVLKSQSRKIEKSQKTREELAKKRKEYFAVKLNGIKRREKKNGLELEKIENQMSIGRELIQKIQKELENTSESSVKKQNQVIQKIEKERQVLENKQLELERISFKREIKTKSLQEKIEQLDKKEIIEVDRNYILSELDDFKKELDKLKGKPISKKLVLKISNLLKEIRSGEAVKGSSSSRGMPAEKQIEKKKKVLNGKLEEFKKKVELNLVEIQNCQKEIVQKKQNIQKINEENRDKQESRVELNDKLRREQFEVEKADKYKEHLKLEQTKIDKELQEILKDIKQSFNGEISELEKKSSGKNLDELKMEIEKLNWQLEQVREINPGVVKEYKELQEKSDFLKKESRDLELTLKELKEVVVEMDKTIKKKMKEAFGAINKEFASYFKMMFGGGIAELERTKIKKRKIISEGGGDLDEEGFDSNEAETDKFEYGLEIKVNPPGKKIANLNMLSGGERTLTSISLLFALISFNPPPFAFLDEIEANLDEPNAERFSKIFKKLSRKTQFILATHSREVMRTADILYGITMDKKDGYSRVFSVNLGQIKEGGEIDK